MITPLFLISACAALLLVSCGPSSAGTGSLADTYHSCLEHEDCALPVDVKSGLLFSGFREGCAELKNGTRIYGDMNINLFGQQSLVVAGEGGQDATRYPVDNVQVATIGGLRMNTFSDLIFGDFFLIPVASAGDVGLWLRVLGMSVAGSPTDSHYASKMYLSKKGRVVPASIEDLKRLFRDRKQFIEDISSELDVDSYGQMKALFITLGE